MIHRRSTEHAVVTSASYQAHDGASIRSEDAPNVCGLPTRGAQAGAGDANVPQRQAVRGYHAIRATTFVKVKGSARTGD